MNIAEAKKIFLISLLVFLLLFIILTFSFYYKSYEAYKLAEEEFKKGNINLAVSHYDYSIRNYSVFDKYSKFSITRLKQIAEDYEKTKQYKKSVLVYQTLLSALSSIETGYSKNKKEIELLITKVQELRRKFPKDEFL